MAMQRLERGLERVGLLTPRMLVPRVTEALKSYQDQGVSEATARQIRKRMNELHPTKGWFPIANGNLPGALWQMEERGTIISRVVTYEDEADTRSKLVYSMAEQPQQPQISTP